MIRLFFTLWSVGLLLTSELLTIPENKHLCVAMALITAILAHAYRPEKK